MNLSCLIVVLDCASCQAGHTDRALLTLHRCAQVREPSARVEHEASTSKIGEDQLFYFQQVRLIGDLHMLCCIQLLACGTAGAVILDLPVCDQSGLPQACIFPPAQQYPVFLLFVARH